MPGVLALAQTTAIAALAADIVNKISHPRSFEEATPGPSASISPQLSNPESSRGLAEPDAPSPSPAPVSTPLPATDEKVQSSPLAPASASLPAIGPSASSSSLAPASAFVPPPEPSTSEPAPPPIITSLPTPSPNPSAPRSPGPVVREKLAALRSQADEAGERHERSEARAKDLELAKLQAEQHIVSLEHRVRVLQAHLSAAQERLASQQELTGQDSLGDTSFAALDIKASRLEARVDDAQLRLHETTQKLWSTTVQVEGQDRKLVSLQQECNKWRGLYETIEAKYIASKEELDKVVQQMS